MGLGDAIDGGDTQQVGKDSACAGGLASPSALPEATQVERDGQQAGPRPGQRELPRQQVAQSNVEVDSPSLPRIGMPTVRLGAHRGMRQGGTINADEVRARTSVPGRRGRPRPKARHQFSSWVYRQRAASDPAQGDRSCISHA